MTASSGRGRRLELKALGEGDAAVLYAAVDSSREGLRRRLRWVSSVRSAEDSAVFIRAAQAEAARGAQLVHGVFEQKTEDLVGIASLQRLLETPGLAEVSVWIRADRLERGYALEAGRLLIAAAFKGDGLHRLYARIDPANRPARKVLQKLGFRYEGCLRHERRLNGRWINQECWGLLRSEWKK